MKASEEFVEGKHGIGFVGSYFKEKCGSDSFEMAATMPTFRALLRSMSDYQIEAELKPSISTLGDIVAFLDAAPQECKDGYANIFYLSSCVVGVDWSDGGWYVSAYGRYGGGWDRGDRVFSPASDRLNTSTPSDLSLESLDSRLRKLEQLINPELLK